MKVQLQLAVDVGTTLCLEFMVLLILEIEKRPELANESVPSKNPLGGESQSIALCLCPLDWIHR